MKAFIYLSAAMWVVALLVALTLAYQLGVKDGRLQGLQCGTDTECEVLEDMLARQPYNH